MDEKENENGNSIIIVAPKGDTGNHSVRGGDDSGAESQHRASLTDVISTIIISSGAVAALLSFEYLCFTHPDSANVVVPLVLMPLLTFIANRWKQRQDDKEANK